MKKFIFSIMAIAFMGMFSSCDGKSTTGSAENDSTAVDSVTVDSIVIND